MLVTTSEGGDLPFLLDVTTYCEREESHVSCTFAAGTDVSITYRFHNAALEELDRLWSTVSYELYLEDRPVDLQAFGTIDFDNPDMGWKMRSWNVVLVDTTPGVITARHVGEVNGESFDDTMGITIAP